MKPCPPATTAAAFLLLLLGGGAAAQTIPLQSPAAFACPQLHVVAARESTTPPGFGSAAALVALVRRAFPGSSAEAVNYPAAGGTPEAYAASVSDGVVAVVGQLRLFARTCPDTILVVHGYAQGAQVIDDAFCGGPDGESLPATRSLVSAEVAARVGAIVLMGNPRHVAGLSFNQGNATAPGFAARPSNFTCGDFENRIQSYCDDPDPYCANGTDAVFHQGYGSRNGHQALEFIQYKILAN